MRLRLASVDEYQALTCLEQGVWGSKNSRFSDWREGDHLAITINKSLAALGTVSGKPFRSNSRIWDNGLYPYRIRIRFHIYLSPPKRPPILGRIRDVLTSAWGPKYGWGILNQQALEGEPASIIVEHLKARENDLKSIQEQLPSLLLEAKAKRDAEESRRRQKTKEASKQDERPSLENFSSQEEPRATPEESTLHSRAQLALVELAKVTGCSAWVATNDQNRALMGRRLGDGCLKILPKMGLSDEAAKRISLIDIIWLSQNAPVAAFEVETTTAIYSGLLRMADLLAVVPALNIKLYIVAPRERQGRVMKELGRPTFQKIGLSDFCRYVAAEDLQELREKVDGLSGHVQPTIIDTIARELDEEESAD